MSKDKTEISYWFEDVNILTTSTSCVPSINEIIFFDTIMDEIWYDEKFSNRKLFRKGVKKEYRVVDVRRFYKNYDYVDYVDKFGIPSQRTVETFEVFLSEIKI
jgi:hypothetical protein